MKFLKAEAFEKHLTESLPDHLSSLYILLISDPFERAFLSKRITGAIGREVFYIDSDYLIDELESPSLFAEKRVVVCDEIEKLKNKSLSLPPDLILILLGKSTPAFFESVKKEGITLDLTKEKPWDRKNRLHRWLLEGARSNGKTLKTDAATYLLERTHMDWASLNQELEKAITFSGNDAQISLETVHAVCGLSIVQTEWQLSEAMVWGGTLHGRSIKQLEDLYGFVGKLRYQLNLGLALLSNGEVPKISPKRLEKLEELVRNLSLPYFVFGLRELLQLELQMRSGLNNHTLLLDYFYTKLAERRHALSSS